jgi:hypothetical protein
VPFVTEPAIWPFRSPPFRLLRRESIIPQRTRHGQYMNVAFTGRSKGHRGATRLTVKTSIDERLGSLIRLRALGSGPRAAYPDAERSPSVRDGPIGGRRCIHFDKNAATSGWERSCAMSSAVLPS